MLVKILISITVLAYSDSIVVSFDNLQEMAEKYSPTLKEIRFNKAASNTNLFGNLSNFLGSAEFLITRTNITYQNPAPAIPIVNPQYTSYLKLSSNIGSSNNLFKTLSGYFESKTAIFNYEDLERQFLLTLKTQYLNTVKLKKLVEAYEKALERNKIYYELVSERYKLGMVSRVDYLKAEIELKNAEINLLNAQNNYRKSRQLLLSYLGLLNRDDYIIIADYEAESIKSIPESLDSFIQLAERLNPSLKNARTLMNSSRSGFIYTLTSISPQVSFEKTWNYSSNTMPEALNNYNEREQWTLQVYINLLNYPISLLNRAQLERAYTYRYKKTLLETMTKIENSYEDLKYNLKTLELATLRFEQAQSAYELTKEQYKAGLISVIQLMDTEANLLQSEVGLIEAKYNLIIAKENLNYLAGTEVIK
ncbi:MAG: TolC family protein [Candidatus Hydrothermia bacterium]